jgi:hypothetical protein
MTRQQKLAGEIRLTRHSEVTAPYTQLEVPVGPADLTGMLLNLQLLLFGLILELVLSSSHEALIIRRSRRTVLSTKGKNRVLEMSDRDLELALSFLLVYHRDEAADVDHIDIEAATDEGDEFDLTITAAAFKPPLSADEARRILTSNG